MKKIASLYSMNPQSVAGIILSSDQAQVLLIKRRDVPVWVLPGGGVEPGEEPKEAIRREILEETGFTVKVERLVGNYFPINRLAKQTHLYECKIENGKASLTLETCGIAFFPIHSLPSLPPPYREWIDDTLKNLPPLEKTLNSVNYLTLLKNLILHPLLVIRFLLARLGFSINSKLR